MEENVERETERRVRMRDRLILPPNFFLGRLPIELYANVLQFMDVGELMILEAAAGPTFFASRMPDLHAFKFAYCVTRRINNTQQLAWIEEQRLNNLMVVRFLAEEEHIEGGSRCGLIKLWLLNGKWHRENYLPAMECANGNRLWFAHDKRHRDNDLPAVERANGDREWWVHGERHRDNDLPAVELANGDREWWVHGKATPQ